jgi:ADP-ribosylation factor GTPase-activating protein 1
MKNHIKTANNSLSNEEFEILLQDKANTICFDCSKTPASWASVNNGIYLCLNCAGLHRGYGVNCSYIRSITIDTWNETQLKFMKLGGNKRLEDLLKVFEVPKSTDPEHLYRSKLLDYHRSQLKSEVSNGKILIPPRIEEALLPYSDFEQHKKENSSNSTNNIYSVSSSSSEDFKPTDSSGPQGGFLSSMGSFFKSAVDKTKNVAYNVSEKVKDSQITNKIVNTGSKAVEVLKDTTYKGVEKIKEGTVKGVEVIKDTTYKGVEIIKDTSGKVIAKGYQVGVIFHFLFY